MNTIYVIRNNKYSDDLHLAFTSLKYMFTLEIIRVIIC